ncbi:MAG: GGDEF domain-containing protein [Blautia hansenii]|nr:GGDEF domain-containing protein [Blautia hansenii]MEE0655208.1 GGDEF domain-containing protein [Blautia hansenii]
MNEAMKEETKSYVTDMANQMSREISYRIQSYERYISETADSFSKMPDRILNEEVLEKKKSPLLFERLVVVDREGNTLPENFMYTNFNKYFEENQDIFEESKTVAIDDRTIFFSSPMIKKGVPDRVLVGIQGSKSLQTIFTEVNCQKEGFSCIVSKNGEVIVKGEKSEKNSQIREWIDEKIKGNEEQAISKMIININQKNQEVFEFPLGDNDTVIMACNSLEFNDWYLLSFIPSTILKENTTPYIDKYWFITLLSIVVFGIVVIKIRCFYKENVRKIEKIAFTDFITGGSNNAAFLIEAKQKIQANTKKKYVMVFLNILGFKNINEKYGVTAGNHALKYIYQVLKKCIYEDEIVARSESDHYFILLQEETEEAVQKRIDIMMQKIHGTEKETAYDYGISFSQGASFIEEKDEELRVYQNRAVVASEYYNNSKHCVFYNKELYTKLNREIVLNESFEKAIEDNEFEVYFQPKINLDNEKTAGAEALVRWKHKEYGMISPGEFISLFEANGKICRLDLYVFEIVCKKLNEWKERELPPIKVSVNLSRVHLMEQGIECLKRFKDIKDRYQIPDGQIELELTESMVIEIKQLEKVKKIIAQIQACGFLCSLDDFGFGYSSLALLKEFDVDIIKLDRLFFVNSNEKTWKVVKAFISLAHELNITVVAEGVEEKYQIEKLKEINCDLIQGYVYARPLPEEEFVTWIEERR